VSLGLRVEIWPHSFITSALYGWVVHVPAVFLTDLSEPVKWAEWAQGENSVVSRYDDNAGSPHAFLTEHWSAV
jgi:hypothetical protein